MQENLGEVLGVNRRGLPKRRKRTERSMERWLSGTIRYLHVCSLGEGVNTLSTLFWSVDGASKVGDLFIMA